MVKGNIYAGGGQPSSRRQPPIYVSSYSYICVLILLYMHPHTPICVPVLLYVSAYNYRGAGRRPTKLPAPATGADVTFQGTVYPYPPDLQRVQVIMALHATRDVGLEVYGPTDMWKELNISSKGMSYGVMSSHIHATSKV
jgi:hypothetical protein